MASGKYDCMYGVMFPIFACEDSMNYQSNPAKMAIGPEYLIRSSLALSLNDLSAELSEPFFGLNFSLSVVGFGLLESMIKNYLLFVSYQSSKY